MAIIDKNLVFVDGQVIKSGVSAAVPLTGLSYAGRMQPIPMRVTVTEAYEADKVASLTLTLQQATTSSAPENGDGAWADVPAATMNMTGTELAEGVRLPWRFVPEGVLMPWIRIKFTVTAKSGQTPAKGGLFAALLREEDFPYIPGLQVR